MIKLNNITKSYNNNLLFKNFNIEIEENKITCILGHSGVGKTTLVNMLCKITEPDEGKIILPDNCNFSYVFQEPRLLDWYSVYDNIEFVLKNVYKPNERKEIIDKYLNLVGLQDYINYKATELSGGMAQRVQLARAFAYPSNVLILDEPFNGIDIKLEEALIDNFYHIWQKDKRTVLFITHNIDQAIYLSNYIYVLNNKPVEIVKKIARNEFSHDTKTIIKSSL